MAKFSHVSRDSAGKRLTAVLEAESRSDALWRLKQSGLTPVSVDPIVEKLTAAADGVEPWYRRSIGPAKRVRLADQAAFWRQFTTVMKAGLPMIASLKSIGGEMESELLKATVKNIIHEMWEGKSFSQALAQHPKIFSPMVISLIAAAEESGSLSQVTLRLADYFESRDRLYRKMLTAMTYPAFVSVFFLVILAASTFFIIPKFKEIYDSFDAKLPPLTTAVFAINGWFLAHFVWICLFSSIGIFFLIRSSRQPGFKKALDQTILRLPVFGPLIQRAAISRFARTLSILMAGGITLNRSLEIVRDTLANSALEEAVGQVREDILNGTPISESFNKHTIFPHFALSMITVGEETGNLGELLNNTAEYYESLVDAAVSMIHTLIEPIIIILIGIFVLIFVLALYLPIFSLASSMR